MGNLRAGGGAAEGVLVEGAALVGEALVGEALVGTADGGGIGVLVGAGEEQEAK